MQLRAALSIALFLVALAGCKKSELSHSAMPPPSAQGSPVSSTTNQAATSASAEVKPRTDACALLSSTEIQSVQGEPLRETKLSGTANGGFSVSQCFFTLPTFTNSISLSVTQRSEGAGARDPKEFWEDTFGNENESKDKSKRVQEKGEEEEGARPPQRIPGIGEEAFWVGGRVGGTLYALRGNSFVRLSVGGPGDQASKIRKSKALMQKVLIRL